MKSARRNLILALALLFASLSSAATTQTSFEEGLSSDELSSFASSLSGLPGRIEAIRFFYEKKSSKASIAVATLDKKSGWQVSIYRPSDDGKYSLVWVSGVLDDSFLVSSADELEVFSLMDEQAIAFSGCAHHVCPNVFSILLYVPSKQTAFTAEYVQGKTSYSSNLDKSENSHYKPILDQWIRKHLKALSV